MQKITISGPDRRALVDHAERGRPNESCALLFGRGGRVSRIFLARNAEESPTGFTIPNSQLIEAYGEAEDSGLEVVGIFHSHPGSAAYPSETDERFMRSNPVAWVIYSGTDGGLRAYVLAESGVREIRVETA